MRGYDSEFIESRIKWKAGKHLLPYPCTDFWRHAPGSVRQLLPESFERPVLFSQASNGRATVIGTEEVAVLDEACLSRVSLDDIMDISSPNITEGRQKFMFNEISITTPFGNVLLPTEDGKGCFAIWSILLMLSRMRQLKNAVA